MNKIEKDFKIDRNEVLDAPDPYYVWRVHLKPWVDSLNNYDQEVQGALVETIDGFDPASNTFTFRVEVSVKERPLPDKIRLGEN